MSLFLMIFGIALFAALLAALIPRFAAGPPPPDGSITTSELKELIDEAVEQATAPLQARITELEAQVDAPSLPPPEDAPLPRPQPDVHGEPQASGLRRPGARSGL